MSRFTKIPVQVEAGVHDVIVAFIDRSHVESDENVGAGFNGIGALGFGAGNGRMPRLGDGVEIVGPYNPTGISKTPSRALIFVCDPKTSQAKPRVRAEDYRKPGAPGLPPAGHRGRCESPHAVLRLRPRKRTEASIWESSRS